MLFEYSFQVPYPPVKQVSPNSRVHWSVSSKAKKIYKTTCMYLTTMAGVKIHTRTKHSIRMHLTFCPPDRRRRDDDNLVASFKAGRDGIAAAMGVDDSYFLSEHAIGDPAPPDGAVLVSITVRED